MSLHPPKGAAPAPFHAGERALQDQFGLAARMDEVGRRVVRDFMPAEHRDFFAELPFVLLGSLDEQGFPRAQLLAGPAGFVQSPDAGTLTLRYAYASNAAIAAELRPGHSVGLLGIQPHTRRRNRANGRVSSHEAGALTIEIAQSFGNCPKYITRRRARFEPALSRASESETGSVLSAAAARLVRTADTFFIASAASPSRDFQAAPFGVDVSHRGGPQGFVQLAQEGGESVLLVPDFAGNFFFNTLGNLMLYPRAGLLFLDFERADLLTLQVECELVEARGLPAAERLLKLHVRSYSLEPNAVPLRFDAAK